MSRLKMAVIRASENGLSFGCATEVEVEMAEFICDKIPHIDMIRMVNSGTEAVNERSACCQRVYGKEQNY